MNSESKKGENKAEGCRSIVAFHTLGCKVNQDETEAMGAIFANAGYDIGDFEEPADIYVINTCTVTHLSDRKSRQMIRRAHKTNPEAIVAVTGCYAQTSPDEIAEMEDVDLVIGTNQRLHIVEMVEQFKMTHEKIKLVTDSKNFTEFEELPLERLIDKTRAYLKVQEGCEQYCTYCIIPYARGPLRSRTLANTIREAKKLEEAGFQELVLAGIHLGAYGQEAGNQQVNITELCQALLAETTIPRIRLSSIEPTEVSDQLIQLIADNPRMCRHLHLPLQAGHDHVLAAMHRPYTTDDFRKQVQKIRLAIPEIAISTDLMVGFPGESDDQFRSCLSFCDEMAFSGMHIFKYSPREGTPASTYENQVDAQIKERRSKQMVDVANKNAQVFMRRYLGKTVEVLVEEQNERGLWEGHTDNYLKIAFNGQAEKGNFILVQVNELEKKWLKGKQIEVEA